jgi:hypothetical protein
MKQTPLNLTVYIIVIMWIWGCMGHDYGTLYMNNPGLVEQPEPGGVSRKVEPRHSRVAEELLLRISQELGPACCGAPGHTTPLRSRTRLSDRDWTGFFYSHVPCRIRTHRYVQFCFWVLY